MKNIKSISFTVNGRNKTLPVDPNRLLIDVLRVDLGLTSVKRGCGEGECGACTVLLNGKPVNSCLVPAMKVQGADVLTVDGLEENGELHPIQDAFIEAGAIQCGFCTPGVVLSAKALLDSNPHPTKEDIADELAGHLCRCTGYVQFYDAIEIAARKIAERKRYPEG
ncbi:MAG: (2Fe-2S)-binding protein [Synergistaceae bacterium]|jgi:carbon-monoxide dehydrogenase small subunit|nr:(2Fe-2S)-binding protein [Synergistaceae bacterium]